FEDEKIGAVALLEIVDRTNPRMIQLCEKFGLAPEAMHPVGVAREFLGQDLDGDVALQFGITRTIHFAHSSGTERTEDGERPELGLRLKRHPGCGRVYPSRPFFVNARRLRLCDPERRRSDAEERRTEICRMHGAWFSSAEQVERGVVIVGQILAAMIV